MARLLSGRAECLVADALTSSGLSLALGRAKMVALEKYSRPAAQAESVAICTLCLCPLLLGHHKDKLPTSTALDANTAINAFH